MSTSATPETVALANTTGRTLYAVTFRVGRRKPQTWERWGRTVAEVRETTARTIAEQFGREGTIERVTILATPEPAPEAYEVVSRGADGVVVTTNPGFHLQSYTLGGVAVDLCPDCAATTPGLTKWSGETINGYCDGCKAGPSVPHYRLVEPSRALTPSQIATLRHQAARVARFGDRRVSMWRIEDGTEEGLWITAADLIAMEALGYFTHTFGGPATYGHTDWYITDAGLAAAASLDAEQPAPEQGALGEPMPQAQAEALARQLLAELSELVTFSAQALSVGERYGGEGDDLDAAYARKKAQIEALGYAVTAGSETGWQLALVEAEAPAACPTCGSDGSPCVDCNPDDEPPAELRPLVEAFARAWDERALSLARVARALAPEPAPHTLPAGCRVRVVFGPDAGQVGTVVSGPDAGGYYSVKVDGREPDDWGGLWYYLPHEITLTTTPPAEDRPWANDAAYAAEGQRIG